MGRRIKNPRIWETMGFRDNLIAPCSRVEGKNSLLEEVDFSALVFRLLLFKKYILQSVRLLEFPAIINVFGIGGTIDLLNSGILKIHCDATSVGQTGQLEILDERREKGLLPLNSYSLSVITITDREKYLHRCLQEVQKRLPLSLKDIIKLKRVIIGALVEIPQQFGVDTVRQTQEDLRSGKTDLLKPLLLKTLREKQGLDLKPENLDVRIHSIDETDFAVETNLSALGLDEMARHKTVEIALLAMSGLNQRVEEMKAFSAISGCIDGESPFFIDRLGFLLRDLRPQIQEQEFQRVIEIAGIPEFLPRLDKIDVSQLLRVRESLELVEFRDWLHSSSALTDEEIGDRVKGLRSKLAGFASSPPAKVARFVSTTAVGLVGTFAGVGIGLIDSFLIDNVLSKPGIWTFVNRLYPSIFKRDEHSGEQ